MLRNWTNHCNLRIEETFRSIGNKNMFFHHRSKLKLIKQFIAEKLLRKISNRGIFCVDIMVKESRFSKNRTWWGSSKIKSNVLYRGQEPVLSTFPMRVRVISVSQNVLSAELSLDTRLATLITVISYRVNSFQYVRIV